jgi:hypothetical protein
VIPAPGYLFSGYRGGLRLRFLFFSVGASPAPLTAGRRRPGDHAFVAVDLAALPKMRRHHPVRLGIIVQPTPDGSGHHYHLARWERVGHRWRRSLSEAGYETMAEADAAALAFAAEGCPVAWRPWEWVD